MGNRLSISAAFRESIEGLPESIVFLPEGRHTIHASQGGKPITLTVTVDESIAAAFQTDLENRLAKNVRPFAGFDHQKGPASFIPKAFRYEAGRGLLLDVEWTKAGREAIEGRNYTYFSPTFLAPDGKISGLPANGEIGSLVNDPAFEAIPAIAANQTDTMTNQILADIGLLTQEQADGENALDLATIAVAKLKGESEQLEAARTERDAAITAAKETAAAEVTAAKAELEAAQSALQAARESQADSIVEAAIQAGKIAPKDAITAAFWRKSILADPESAKVLSAQPSRTPQGLIVAGKTEGALAIREMPKADFDKLPPYEKSEFAKNGGKIIE